MRHLVTDGFRGAGEGLKAISMVVISILFMVIEKL